MRNYVKYKGKIYKLVDASDAESNIKYSVGLLKDVAQNPGHYTVPDMRKLKPALVSLSPALYQEIARAAENWEKAYKKLQKASQEL